MTIILTASLAKPAAGLGHSQTQLAAPKTAGQPTGLSFADTLQHAGAGFRDLLQPKLDPHQGLQQFEQKLEKGQTFSGRELILYQIKASQFHLHVEFISKIADSLLTSVKKLQNAA